MTSKCEKGQRTLYLDVARAAAIIFVCLNHAVNRSYVNYHGQMAEFLSAPLMSTLFKTLCTLTSQLGVPLFLMISGVLILNKTMESPSDIKRFYKHNLFSIFLTAEIWYVLIYWFLLLFDPDYASLRQQGLGPVLWGMVKTMLFQNQLTFGTSP